MAFPTPLLARRVLAVLACAAPFALAHAQSLPQPVPAQPPVAAQQQQEEEGRRNQKVEHIHVEDSGARVDEVRYGGRTQSINVTPKADVPGYQVLPDDGGRSRQGAAETSSGGNGPRVWNVLKF